jgi:hypothetical protein
MILSLPKATVAAREGCPALARQPLDHLPLAGGYVMRCGVLYAGQHFLIES